jgi:hypothetical protein
MSDRKVTALFTMPDEIGEVDVIRALLLFRRPMGQTLPMLVRVNHAAADRIYQGRTARGERFEYTSPSGHCDIEVDGWLKDNQFQVEYEVR